MHSTPRRASVSAFARILTILLLCQCLNTTAQDTPGAVNVFKIPVVDPGISYEQRIGHRQTMSFQAILRSHISLGYSDALGTTSDIYFDPSVNVQYRYYYNFDKRSEKGKNTLRNSANYLTALTVLQLSKLPLQTSAPDEPDRRLLHSVGAAWGFQRNYNSHISLDIQLGGEFLYGRTSAFPIGSDIRHTWHGRFSEMIRLQFGFWIK
jgi:hypothetical protein